MSLQLWRAVALLLSMTPPAAAFKEQDFKKCKDSAFCTRLRGAVQPQYAVQPGSVQLAATGLQATVQNTADNTAFTLHLTALEDTLRVRVLEPGNTRYEVQDVLLPDLPQTPITRTGASQAHMKLDLNGHAITLRYSPFQIDVDGAMTHNDRSMFGIEHRREKPAENATAGEWEETFKSHKDSKPKGPQALSLDITFSGFSHVYGLPEHAAGFALPVTTGGDTESEPYRLYNLDVFEYLADSPFGLYGSIPFLTAHNTQRTVGAFWLNAAEMYVDVARDGKGTQTQWWAESGVIDLFLMLGPAPGDVVRQYAALTGTAALPPLFSLGYHQCRWNYKDEADVEQVNAGFDAHAMPCDVIWLDIEHTDGKRYMTWDATKFPTPTKMLDGVAAAGRKMVTIVDPHVKRDDKYELHKEATKKRYYVRNKDGGDFEGWCWPGSSSYLDVVNPEIRSWWADFFTLKKYSGSTQDLHIWNDMNEPSVFNGPEITMPKDALHFGDVEHRDVHNVYGFYYHMATAEGLRRRGAAAGGAPQRPFVLSRALFAGTQRAGPVWTGDNAATWEQLRVTTPMLLALNVAGLPNSGADVGGFFGNPEPELLVRWYQAGVLQPFLRGHAHIESARREPWLFGEPHTTHIRDALRERYALLPYLYTLFRAANATGAPVMRPLWYEFPTQEHLFDEQHAFLLGPALLAAPVMEEGATAVTVQFPQGPTWYDADTGADMATGGNGNLQVAVTAASMPRFYRSGHIVPRRERLRRSTRAQRHDPFTLIVALDRSQVATGELYLDDGATFEFQEGKFIHADVTYDNGVLKYEPRHAGMDSALTFERVVVMGHEGAAKGVALEAVYAEVGAKSDVVGGDEGPGGYERSVLVVRNPQTPVARAWTLKLQTV